MNTRKDNSAGFTLIELLVAISIFSVVIITLYSVFWSGLHAWKEGQNYITQNLPIQLAFERMQKELRNSFKFSLVPFVGDTLSVSFPLVINGDIHRIEYTYEPDKKVLLRKEQSLSQYFAKEIPNRRRLCSNIDNFVFSYSYKNEIESDVYKWKDIWQPKEPKLPKGIRVDLISGKDLFTKIIEVPQGEPAEDAK